MIQGSYSSATGTVITKACTLIGSDTVPEGKLVDLATAKRRALRNAACI